MQRSGCRHRLVCRVVARVSRACVVLLLSLAGAGRGRAGPRRARAGRSGRQHKPPIAHTRTPLCSHSLGGPSCCSPVAVPLVDTAAADQLCRRAATPSFLLAAGGCAPLTGQTRALWLAVPRHAAHSGRRAAGGVPARVIYAAATPCRRDCRLLLRRVHARVSARWALAGWQAHLLTPLTAQRRRRVHGCTCPVQLLR